MIAGPHTLLLALLLLQVKHFLADFALQTERQTRGKGFYGDRAGVEHAGIHVVLTFLCLLVVGVPVGFAAVVAAAEFVVHYHQDWLRAAFMRRRGITPADRLYWILMGEDQMVHQLTYLAIVWVLI